MNETAPRGSLPRISRRQLGRWSAALLPIAVTRRLAEAVPNGAGYLPDASAETIARDELYWRPIADAYDYASSPLNLIAGANNPSPRFVMDTLVDQLEYINPSPLARSRNSDVARAREGIRNRLARLAGASKEEIALTRGTTEGMNIALFGHPLEAGDEILTTRHDYFSMRSVLAQRAKRDGLTVRELDFQVPVESQDRLVELFASHLSERTLLILICHVLDGYGLILPVRQICEMARERGIAVAVDGALGFGHVPVDLHDLGCDYYATSLHKWLGAPRGTGFLYVRRERIADLQPLYGVASPESDEIGKLEPPGTKSEAPFLAVGAALEFFERIGPERKFARLRYLKRYWSDQVAEHPAFTFLARRGPEFTGSTLPVEIAERLPRDVWLGLLRQRQINIGIHPYREDPTKRSCNYLAPNVFNRLDQLDLVAETLIEVADKGLPS